MRVPLLLRLHAHDRALFSRFALTDDAPRWTMRGWLAITHLGGATATIIAVLLPLLGLPLTAYHAVLKPYHAVALGAWSLLLSHLAVQIVKRNTVRPRPDVAIQGNSLVYAPDRFSFPSGHASSAMTVACVYSLQMPPYAMLFIAIAVLIGMSRVRLGVHFFSDVIAGQAISIATVLGAWAVLR